MSSCYGMLLQEVGPLTARAAVAEPSGPIKPTPVPVACDICESDVELLYLSRKKLVGFPEFLYWLIFLVLLVITYHCWVHCVHSAYTNLDN